MRDFPIGTVDKNLPSNAGDTRSIPGSGRFHISGPVGVEVRAAAKICAQLLKPLSLEPVLHKNRNHCNEKPKHSMKNSSLKLEKACSTARPSATKN